MASPAFNESTGGIEDGLDRIDIRPAAEVNDRGLWRPVQGDDVLFDPIANTVIVKKLTNLVELGNRQHEIRPRCPIGQDMQGLSSHRIDHRIVLTGMAPSRRFLSANAPPHLHIVNQICMVDPSNSLKPRLPRDELEPRHS
jgi:hypothetical protein